MSTTQTLSQVDQDLLVALDRYVPEWRGWPGVPVLSRDVVEASKNPRDWFTPQDRLRAWEYAWKRFIKARMLRKTFHRGYEWDQILVTGDYGAGKSTIVAYETMRDHDRGLPVFHVGGPLFGFKLGGDEVFTAMGMMPYNSQLVVDEAHSWLASRLSGATSVSMFLEVSANIRKSNVRLFIMTAQDRQVAASIRHFCVKVYKPIKVKVAADGGVTPVLEGERVVPQRIAPKNDPSRFVLGVNVWDDYPYRQGDLIDSSERDRKKGFGPWAHRLVYYGAAVREAFMLTPSFGAAAVGGAMLANKEQVKAQARVLRDYVLGEATGEGPGGVDRAKAAVLDFLAVARKQDNGQEWLTATSIGAALGMSAQKTGQVVQGLFPGITFKARRGYHMPSLFERLDDHIETTEGG